MAKNKKFGRGPLQSSRSEWELLPYCPIWHYANRILAGAARKIFSYIEIVDDVNAGVRSGQEEFTVRVNNDWEATAVLDASERERAILAAGGRLPYVRQQHEDGGAAAPSDD